MYRNNNRTILWLTTRVRHPFEERLWGNVCALPDGAGGGKKRETVEKRRDSGGETKKETTRVFFASVANGSLRSVRVLRVFRRRL